MDNTLIIGAGAAGCTLAYLLARTGRSVTLVERQRVAEKDKLCAGVLVESAQLQMAELFGPRVLDELGAVSLPGMRVLYRALETTLAMRAFRVLPRARLDAYLLEQAVAAGAELVERCVIADVDEAAHTATLRDLDTGGEKRVGYGALVGADGALSALRKMVTGALPRTIVSLEATTPTPADTAFIVQRVYPAIAGSCWLIPQGPRAAVGCLFFPEVHRGPMGDQRAMLSDFATELGCTMDALRGAPVPVGDDILLRSPGGTPFIGDAAGLIDPALGAGIHFALLSARLLADDLLGGERYEDAMAGIVADVREKIGSVFGTYLRLGMLVLMHNNRLREADRRARREDCLPGGSGCRGGEERRDRRVEAAEVGELQSQ